MIHFCTIKYLGMLLTSTQQLNSTQDYERLDTLIPKSLLYAERSTGKQYMRKYELDH